MEKIVVCIMGQNCEKFIGMCLESVKDADALVFCDGGSTDETDNILQEDGFEKEMYQETGNKTIIFQDYNQEDKGMNGKQRNFYLKYLKENFKGYWALCLDTDEVVDDLSKIKEFIQLAAKDKLYSPKMVHFIQDLGHEDATQPQHFVPNRLFYIDDDLSYPEVEHPVLESEDRENLPCLITTIFHLAYIPNLFEYKNKYENHLKKSEIHSKSFLDNWYRAHLFGGYPKKQFDLKDIPQVILNHFGIDKDEIYFANRNIELKHPMQVKQWYEYFKPSSVLDLGCGKGCYLKFWRWFVPKSYGIEISKYAKENSFCEHYAITCGDINDENNYKNPFEEYDLITAIDVLEHLPYDKLDNVLSLMIKYGKKFLFSIPFIGDENLENDKTHLIKETKDWWISKLSEHFKIIDAPQNWLFSNQLLIGERKCV